MFEGPVQDLIDELGRLPGVGPKSAQRIAFHLLAAESADVSRLVAALQRVQEESGIIPDVNQVQLSPYSTRSDAREYHSAHDIVTESWSPLGASSDALRSDPLITSIANDHGKSPTQIVLRWHVQLGLVVIPRSSHPGRLAENIDIFDFELTEEEMSKISSLDRGESVVTDSDQFGH